MYHFVGANTPRPVTKGPTSDTTEAVQTKRERKRDWNLLSGVELREVQGLKVLKTGQWEGGGGTLAEPVSGI